MKKKTKINKEALIYEDKKLYVFLADNHVTKGHVVVIWKNKVKDLHLLKKTDYEHLMNKVDGVRDAMLKALKINKVYLVYMDELKHVHWHLIPRYNEEGYDVFKHKPIKTKDFSLTKKIKEKLS